MNARSHSLELSVESFQVDEAVSCLFHTVLLHRSLGKFCFAPDGTYTMGTVGLQDVDCDFIDLTYICCSSPHLDRKLRSDISEFSECLRRDNHTFGQITLEFFQKKKARWPFQPECIPWEVWNVRVDLLKICNETNRQISKEKISDSLSDKIIYIAEIMNRHEYLPSIPPQSELDLVFDTSFADIQPYLFKTNYLTSGASSPSVGSAVQKLIRDTLSLS